MNTAYPTMKTQNSLQANKKKQLSIIDIGMIEYGKRRKNKITNLEWQRL